MTDQTTVTVLDLDPSRQNAFGPAVIEHRTAQAEFAELGVYYLTFEDAGRADPWTLEYEETVYVIRGEARIVVDSEDGREVRAGEGQLIALPKGCTVSYGGSAGTQLLLSMAPVNWRERQTEASTDSTPRVLFLTPFHFGSSEHDAAFDQLAEQLLDGQKDFTVVARHLGAFEGSDDTYDADQEKAILSAVREAHAEKFDAIVIACHYDPAVAAARQISTVPVVAPLQVTTGLAAQHGPRFAVITDVAEAEPVISGLVEQYGHRDICDSVTAIGWDGDAILDDTKGAAAAVDTLVEKLAAAGHVQSVVIGCTIVSAAYELHRSDFPDRGLAVINSNLATVRGASALLPR
jgi:Asp/Glu/hydantoin racemase/quercetin dioxygenase-like cupin family protein